MHGGRVDVDGDEGNDRGVSDEEFVIPSAPFDDLDLDREEDMREWERRTMAMAAENLRQARARLERMGIIDRDGKLVSDELPADMQPESETSVETG